MAEFAKDHPTEFSTWMSRSNYICILQVPSEFALLDHAAALSAGEYKHSMVFEPDIGEHTALVIAPGSYHSRLSSLPLAGREVTLAV